MLPGLRFLGRGFVAFGKWHWAGDAVRVAGAAAGRQGPSLTPPPKHLQARP